LGLPPESSPINIAAVLFLREYAFRRADENVSLPRITKMPPLVFRF